MGESSPVQRVHLVTRPIDSRSTLRRSNGLRVPADVRVELACETGHRPGTHGHAKSATASRRPAWLTQSRRTAAEACCRWRHRLILNKNAGSVVELCLDPRLRPGLHDSQVLQEGCLARALKRLRDAPATPPGCWESP